ASRLQRPTRGRQLALRRDGSQLPGVQLAGGALVICTQRREGLLRELHRITLALELRGLFGREGNGFRHPLTLAAQCALALDLRAQARGARIERLQALQLMAELLVSRRIVAHRDRREIALERLVTLFLLGDLAPDLRELLQGALHLGQAALESTDGFQRLLSAIAEGFDLDRHLRELLDAPP